MQSTKAAGQLIAAGETLARQPAVCFPMHPPWEADESGHPTLWLRSGRPSLVYGIPLAFVSTIMINLHHRPAMINLMNRTGRHQ